jgi:uncharacterized membrane protein HdeD (DUF308 family)
MSPSFERQGVIGAPVRAATKGTSSFLLGMILFALGILGLIFADVLTFASVITFGVLLVGGGVAELVHARRHREGDRLFLAFLSGLLSLAVGIVIILRPQVGVAGSGLLIAGWLLATGLFRAVIALMDRYRYWGWDFSYGILSILLGFWVTSSLPTSAVWLLGTVVAVELMARGVAVMGASFALQRLERAAVATR